MYCDKMVANRSKSQNSGINSSKDNNNWPVRRFSQIPEYDTVCFDKIVEKPTTSVGQVQNSGITNQNVDRIGHSRRFMGVAGNDGMTNGGLTNGGIINGIPPGPLDTTYAVGIDVGPNNYTGNEGDQRGGYFDGGYSTTSSQCNEEFECTINVGDNFVQISGDSLRLVQVASILVNDFFTSDEFATGLANNPDFIHNLSVIDDETDGVGRTTFEPHEPQTFLPPFDSNPFRNGSLASDPQMAVNEITNGPVIIISDSEDGHSTGHGQLDQPQRVVRSRRSHFSREQDNVNDKGAKNQGNGIVYEIQLLKLLSKSPLSLSSPRDWAAVSNQFPGIVRTEIWMDGNNNRAD